MSNVGDPQQFLSGREGDLFVAFIGRLVEDLQQADMTELQAVQFLDNLLTPSFLYLRYKNWTPQRRADLVRALQEVHPEGGLLSIVHRAHHGAAQAAERIARLDASRAEKARNSVRQTAPVSQPQTSRFSTTSFGLGVIAAIAVVAILVLAGWFPNGR